MIHSPEGFRLPSRHAAGAKQAKISPYRTDRLADATEATHATGDAMARRLLAGARRRPKSPLCVHAGSRRRVRNQSSRPGCRGKPSSSLRTCAGHGLGIVRGGQLWAPAAVVLYEITEAMFDPKNLLNPQEVPAERSGHVRSVMTGSDGSALQPFNSEGALRPEGR